MNKENEYDIRRKTIKEVAKNIDLLRKNQFEGKNDPTFRAVFSVLSSMYQSHGWENGVEGLFE